MIDYSEDYSVEQCNKLIEECERHIEFVKDSSFHARTSILIERLCQHLMSMIRNVEGYR